MSYRIMQPTTGMLLLLGIALSQATLVAETPPNHGVGPSQTEKRTETENQRPSKPHPETKKNKAPSSTSWEQFVPKEKIPADTAISFPVDI